MPLTAVPWMPLTAGPWMPLTAMPWMSLKTANRCVYKRTCLAY
jgi:hypothetical protein